MKRLLIGLALTATLMPQAQELETVNIGGQNRTIMVYEPKDLQRNSPLVISLHGAGQDAAYQRDQTKWNNCADSAKFVVVYPNAINKFWDVYGTSDITFIESLIDMMYERHRIDRNRVYVTGFSLGAMMTYHCIEHLGDKVAAFAPVSGVRFDNKKPIAPRRVPIIHTHGTGDNVFYWTGDLNHAAGGYPYIPDYVESWAAYEGLDQKEEIKPYPASNPNSIASLTTWRSSDPNDSIEVALLALKDKGHWHSEDLASGVSTTQEIWKFCKRYSLGPAEPVPPTLMTVEPENMSFDLPLTQRTFTFQFEDPVDKTSINAILKGKEQTFLLKQEGTEADNIVKFSLSESDQLNDGDYKLNLTNIKSPEGGDASALTFTYTYGITEVGDELNIETILDCDWRSYKDDLGEGIPYGWWRANSKADGSNDIKESGTPNVTGARLKHFMEGGEFDSGFYLSAREYDKCDFSYGKYDDYPLTLTEGKYQLSFRSIYWNESSQNNNVPISVSLFPKEGDEIKNIVKEEVESTGCLNEKCDLKVTNSMLHEMPFEIEEDGNYIFNLAMYSGWNATIVGDVVITTYPSAADIYKGGLKRMIIRAKELCALTEDVTALSVWNARNRLLNYIEKYENLESTSPSVYQKAMDNLEKNMIILESYLESANITTIDKDEEIICVCYYTVDGRKVNNPNKGIYIKKLTTNYGEKTIKVVF